MSSPELAYQPLQMGNFTPQVQISMPNQKIKEAKIKKLQAVIKRLGIGSVILSIIMFCGGIAEVAINPCITHGYSDYGYSNYRYPYYPYLEDDFQTCLSAYTIGQGIWCSIFPLIAGIFGIVAGRNAKNQAKIKLLMGFSIVGATFAFLLVVLQPIFLTLNLFRNTPGLLAVQIIISSVAFVNFVLLIITTAYSFCLSNCCCNNGNARAETSQMFCAVPYQNQQYNTIVPLFPGQPCYNEKGFPQDQNHSENAQTLSAPPNYDNRDFKTTVN